MRAGTKEEKIAEEVEDARFPSPPHASPRVRERGRRGRGKEGTRERPRRGREGEREEREGRDSPRCYLATEVISVMRRREERRRGSPLRLGKEKLKREREKSRDFSSHLSS